MPKSLKMSNITHHTRSQHEVSPRNGGTFKTRSRTKSSCLTDQTVTPKISTRARSQTTVARPSYSVRTHSSESKILKQGSPVSVTRVDHSNGQTTRRNRPNPVEVDESVTETLASSSVDRACDGNIRRSTRTRNTKSALELLGVKVKKEPVEDYEIKNIMIPKKISKEKPESSENIASKILNKSANVAQIDYQSYVEQEDVATQYVDRVSDSVSMELDLKSDDMPTPDNLDHHVESDVLQDTESEDDYAMCEHDEESHEKQLIPNEGTSVQITEIVSGKLTAEKKNANKISRSGRVISSPRKFREYMIADGSGYNKPSSVAALEKNLTAEQHELYASLLPNNHRKRPSRTLGDPEHPAKMVKVITQKDGKVSVMDSPKYTSPAVTQAEQDTDIVQVLQMKQPHYAKEISAVRPEIQIVQDKDSRAYKNRQLQTHGFENELLNEEGGQNLPARIKAEPHCDEQNKYDTIEATNFVIVQPDCNVEEVVETEQLGKVNSPDAKIIETEYNNYDETADGDTNTDQVIMGAPEGDKDRATVTGEDGQITYEALIKLASEVVNQVEGYDSDVVYQVQLQNGKVSHFMFKNPDEKTEPEILDYKPKKVIKKSSGTTAIADPVTSEELETQDIIWGKTKKGRARPSKQLVVKKELQELIDKLEPSDNMDQHVEQISSKNTGLSPRGQYNSRYKSGNKYFKCKYCVHIIEDRHDFRKHIKQHPQVEYKPYACPLCEYRTDVRASVVRHINIHSEVMPYVCTHCGRGFNFKQKLLTHMKYHRDVRDYQCPHCVLAFHEYKTLKNHIRCIHGPEKFIPSGEEAKGLKDRASALSRLAATKPPIAADTEEQNEASMDEKKISKEMTEGDTDKSSNSEHTQPESDDLPGYTRQQCEDDDSVNVVQGSLQNLNCEVASSVELNSKEQIRIEFHEIIEPETLSERKTSSDVSMVDVSTKIMSIRKQEDKVAVVTSNTEKHLTDVRRRKISKCTGTNKTKHITNRYREGLTKFGASHDEIAASCPWRNRSKIRRHFVEHADANIYEAPVISIQYLNQSEEVHAVNDEQVGEQVDQQDCEQAGEQGIRAAVASIEVVESDDDNGEELNSMGHVLLDSHPDSVDGALPAAEADVYEVVGIVNRDGSMKMEHTSEPVVEQTKPEVVTSITIAQLEQPKLTLEEPKSAPFVSNKDLTSSFDAVCQVDKETEEGLISYRCRLCNKVTYNKTMMVHHLEKEHQDIKLWQCNKCNYKCRLRSSIFVHMKLHEGNKKHECAQCGKGFTLYSKMKQHMTTHATTGTFKCENCDKVFKRKNDLKKHDDRIHNPDRPFRCEVCDKTFKDKVQVKRHMDTHIEGRNLLCHVCKKYYKNKSSLQQHLKSHMCRFFCELCNKPFGSYSGFMAHKVMHTESFEGFHCDLCGKVLHTKGSLNRHLTISHSTARPFSCSDCKSAFKTKKDLRNHAIVHSSSKNFECAVCGFKSKRCESLQVHMRRHDDIKPFRCGICGREYTQKRSLQLHLHYHLNELQSQKCQICNKKCITKAHLEQHINKEHFDGEAETGIDEDIEKLDPNTSNTFYMCEECNSVFLTQNNLAIHILVQHMNQPQDLKVELKTKTSHQDGEDEQKMDDGDGPAADLTPIDINDDMTVISYADLMAKDDSKNSIAQYVAITDPKSKQKRVVTVMHPITKDTLLVGASQDVEVEGEVIMNMTDALVDASGGNDIIKTEAIISEHHDLTVGDMLDKSSEALVTVPTDTISMTFTIPKDTDYVNQVDSQSVVSFMDPSTNEEFSVAMPQQTLVNLLTPAMETEVVSSMHGADLGEDSMSVNTDTVVSLSDTIIPEQTDASVTETVLNIGHDDEQEFQ